MIFKSPGLIIMLLAGVVLGEEPATREAGEKPAGGAPALTVAVLDFAANDLDAPDLGAVIGQTVTVMLSGEPGFRLVDREALQKTLQEQELNLSGMVETDQAVKVGKLVGARIIVVGKAFQLGQKLFITAKLIGAETTLVDGVLVKSEAGRTVDELVLELATKIAERLKTNGAHLVASPDGPDPVPALKAALAGKVMPAVAVVVTEEHIARQRPAAVDPAVETEIKLLLRECGVIIKDVEANALSDWAKSMKDGKNAPWPRGLDDVDWVITGEAFSEFAAQFGNLNSCNARAEINVIDRKTGNIILADRQTSRGVDLSENLAGRTALQKAGRALGIRLLEHLHQNLPQPQQ